MHKGLRAHIVFLESIQARLQKVDLLQIKNWKSGELLIFVLAIQVITTISVILDIPVARQVISFLYLTLVPGMIILKVLKLRDFDLAEAALLSVGLSVAFLMFIGLLINELYPLIGISKPLSLEPLMITINFVLILLCFIVCFRDKASNISIKSLNVSPLILLLLFLPLVGFFGILQVNNSEGIFLLLLTILTVCGLVSLCVISKKLFPSRFYPLVLFVIMIALLSFVNSSLLTNYIVGGDIHDEFFVFRLTEKKSQWNLIGIPQFDIEILKANAMISVTILPTIYSQILSLDGTWLFKIIYPLFAMFGVLALYQLYCTQTEKETAFLASFFFVSICIGIGWGSDKQLLAQLFYVLLLYILFKRELSPSNRKIFFIVFSAALVISHYALAYLFLFIIACTWASLLFMRKSNGKISASLVAIFFSMTFLWSIYISRSAPFVDLIRSTEYVSRTFFTSFLDPQSRGTQVLRGLALSGEAVSFWRYASRALFLITELFIVVGVVKYAYALIAKRRKMSFDLEYTMLISVNFVIIILNIVLPGLSGTFLMQRFYQTALLILAPLCILGGKTILEYVPKLKTKNLGTILTLAVLIPVFLFQTEFVYALTGDYMSNMTLGVDRMDEVKLYTWITNEQEVLGAQWLPKHVNITQVIVYTDGVSLLHDLTSYGLINRERIRVLSNTTRTLDSNSFIYLRRINIVHGIMQERYLGQWNTSDISSLIDSQNKIYSNGNCDIYKSTR